MHMDEEDVTNIVEREVEAYVCEAEKEHINVQGLDCNVDGEGDSETHCDKTHVDGDCKVRCALMILVVGDEIGEVEIVNEHMHASMSHYYLLLIHFQPMIAL